MLTTIKTQGALYILGESLVQTLNSVRDRLQFFRMEDAMLGSWLLGLDKVTNMDPCTGGFGTY